MLDLDLFRALDEEAVRYLLVGGLALNIHGVERATMDVDLMVALDSANLEAFLRAANRLNLKPAAPVSIQDLLDADKRKEWIEKKHMLAFALRPPQAYGPTIDVLIHSPVAFEQAWLGRIAKNLGGLAINVANIDDLIAMKTGTGRIQDEADIEALTRLRQLGLE
jgi:hypothetical protein